MRTAVAFYETFQRATDAIRELVDIGIPRDSISLIANNAHGEYSYPDKILQDVESDKDTTAGETSAGASIGAGVDAIRELLVGLGVLTVSGIGLVIAAGPLAVALSTLTGAGVGAVAGGTAVGLIGALIRLGIPEEEAGIFTEGVRQGAVLLTIQADDLNTEQITDALNRHEPIDIYERTMRWREKSRTGFDNIE